jgi:ATP adenylyltransferase
MLVTKTYKTQTERLEQDDIQAGYACLQNWGEQEPKDRKRELFAFFNSGEHSGASQPHRHLQFIPVENIAADIPGQKWELLMSRLTTESRDVPFTYFWSPIPLKPSPAQLHQIYSKLYDSAAAVVRDYNKINSGKLEKHDAEDGSSTFSYNLGMTTSAMVICPRRSEAMPLKRDDGSDIGFTALNGTLLAGSIMVKNQEQWNFLRSRPDVLDDILGAIGIPPDAVEHHSGAKI